MAIFRRHSGRTALLAVCAMFVCIWLQSSSSLLARPEYQDGITRYYEGFSLRSLAKCTACHDVPTGLDVDRTVEEMPPHNLFGEAVSGLEWNEKPGKEPAEGADVSAHEKPADLPTRLFRLAELDSDGDGLANELELLGGSSPGDAASRLEGEALKQAETAWAKFKARYTWNVWKAVSRPETPQPRSAEWSNNPIDRFVADEHEKRGLVPASEAPKEMLLRRVSLDLTGLPPTREQLHDFLSDSRPDAYEELVERLLASPAYGERWGRHWMDIWRYSDWAGWSDGGQIRDSQPHIWRWRDWIIESLNEDKGYDQMVMEMLAADELAPADEKALRATGYLARNYKMLSRETWLQDVVNHTTKAFLGSTLECARCHDHKFDAVSQEEYYRFRAIFEPHSVRVDPMPAENGNETGLARAFDADSAAPTYVFHRGDDRQPIKERIVPPGVPLLWGGPSFAVLAVNIPKETAYRGLDPSVRTKLLAAAEKELLDCLTKSASAPADATPSAKQLLEAELKAAEAALLSLRARIAADDLRYDSPESADVAAISKGAALAERRLETAKAEKELLTARVALETVRNGAGQDSASPDAAKTEAIQKAEADVAEKEKKLAAAQAAASSAGDSYSPLTPVYPMQSTGRRLALARWIVHPSNPLASRVAANHLWGRHFGQPIVPTTFDFGQGGRPPTLPALLDWMAAELIQPRWSMQRTDQGCVWQEVDDAGRPWSMKHLHRLIVTSKVYKQSSIHDTANAGVDQDNLYLSRWPLRRLEAEAVRDSMLFTSGLLDASRGGPEIDHMQGAAIPRRSIYFRHAAEKQMTLLKVFDCASVSECYERRASIVPQQALALMNSDFSLKQAEALAQRWAADKLDDAEFVLAAFETLLTRAPTQSEMHDCLDYLRSSENGATESAATESAATGPLNAAAAAARQDLIHVLFNHNDFAMLR